MALIYYLWFQLSIGRQKPAGDRRARKRHRRAPGLVLSFLASINFWQCVIVLSFGVARRTEHSALLEAQQKRSLQLELWSQLLRLIASNVDDVVNSCSFQRKQHEVHRTHDNWRRQSTINTRACHPDDYQHEDSDQLRVDVSRVLGAQKSSGRCQNILQLSGDLLLLLLLVPRAPANRRRIVLL